MMEAPCTFHAANFYPACDAVAQRDADLQAIINRHGYPPCWSREPNFETLIHIILEQQVSLASAKAALEKLREKTGMITPENLLLLTDEELRACYFSRQKAGYARELARAISSGDIDLAALNHAADTDIRAQLKKIKGIGDWTVDVYLLMALHRSDVFPVGDLAMMNSLKKVKQLPPDTSREAVLLLAEPWRPYRSIAAMLLWHQYLSERNKKPIKVGKK